MSRPTPDRGAFEAALAYSFRDKALLERALTHSSALAPTRRLAQSYQRLEFLGDRVLGLVVSEHLFRAHPDKDEGDLSKALAAAVRKESCAEVARSIGLGAQLRLGKDEARSGGADKSAILADALEGLIGAIYLDGGADAARDFVVTWFNQKLEEDVTFRRDPKTTLQEWAQARGLEPPVYAVKSRTGPAHEPEFTIEVSLPGFSPLTALGNSKKVAENSAAREFLLREKVWKAAP